ncbi:MAG: FAD-binding oxidoreductase [Vicinamibacteraceae bacterium]
MTPPRSTLRTGQPVWLSPRLAHQPPRHPQLSGDQRTDVVIVGGGITGTLAALRFAQAGVDTIVLEADRIGHGSTAASSALLLQEPDARLSTLIERYGTATARRIWRVSHDAARDLIALLQRLPSAGAVPNHDTVYYTTDVADVAALHAEYVARRRAGFAATWLTPRDLRVDAGVPARAGIRTRGNAQCDPFRACLAVEHEAGRQGARFFERSPVRRIETHRGGVRVRTASGVVEGRQVIVATGYATRQFKPLAGRFQLSHTYVVATPPLGPRARRELGLPDVMLWDTRRQYHYARWTADHRLLLGGADRPIRSGGRPAAARLAAAVAEIRTHFERVLPALGDVAFSHAWEGRFANTPDSLPYVGPHRLYPGHAFALGYGGNGMTFGSLAGRLLVEQWQGVASKDHALFAFNR